MEKLRIKCAEIAYGKPFDIFITIVILVNSFLIGVQTTNDSAVISGIQTFILYIFTLEVIMRFIAAGSVKEYFKSGWNIFDLSLVIIGWIPPTMVSNAQTVMALRVLRVFRVLRLLRTLKEIKLIIAVLARSMKSLLYNGILFFIFMYLFAVAGVSMFRLPEPDKMTPEQLENYERFMAEAPPSPANSPDPFGSIGESFFTLFRELTGEDWTDIRYNLMTASEYGIIEVSPSVVTVYHVLWFCLAAFLLLNLVTGAVINNYQISIAEAEARRKEKCRTNPDGTPRSIYSSDRLLEFGMSAAEAEDTVKYLDECADCHHDENEHKGLIPHYIYIQLDKKIEGPFDDRQFAELVRARTVRRDTLCWLPGMEEWKSLADMPDLLKIIALTPPPVS